MVFTDVSEASFAQARVALRKLDAQYGSEAGYMQSVLEDLASRETIICNQCFFENKIEYTEERMQLCSKCRKEIWHTAETFYHKVRLFRPRVVIREIYQQGITISVNQAAELLDVANGTAALVFKQLGIVVSRLNSSNGVQVPTQFCTSVVSRRSTETPAREPPVAEEFELRRKLQEESKASEVVPEVNLDLNEPQQKLLESLSHEPILFEELSRKTNLEPAELTSQLMFFELNGIAESCPGNKFKLADSLNLAGAFTDPYQLAKAQSIAKTFAYFIKDYFQGVSRKYLQIYASIHRLSVDRKSFPPNSLRKLCAAHSHISYEDILAYVTPPAVLLAAPHHNTS